MIGQMIDCIMDGSEALGISLRTRAAMSRKEIGMGKGQTKSPEPKLRKIRFPGTTAKEAWNFSEMMQY